MKKSDLINILVEEYGYEKEDLKFDSEGKPYTNGKLMAIIEAEKRDAEAMENNTFEVSYEQKIKDDEKIAVMSGSMGTVIYRSTISNRAWRFNEFGQIDKMPYSELVSIQNRSNGYLKDGAIVILDKRVQEEFGLTEMYKYILTPQNIDSVFEKDADELEEFVSKLPDGMKIAFCNKAQELFAENKINDRRIIRMIEDVFGFSLDDNAPISDIALKTPKDKIKDGVIYIDSVR